MARRETPALPNGETPPCRNRPMAVAAEEAVAAAVAVAAEGEEEALAARC